MIFLKSGRNQAGVEDASLALAEAQSSIGGFQLLDLIITELKSHMTF